MANNGNATFICKKCGIEFIGWASKDRKYCSTECAKACHKGTHRESKTRLYCIWCGMKARCLRPTAKVYAYYGGRGISVCPEWAGSYLAFREWAVANGYGESLELDRINTNGNYEPSNCRWVTFSQQMRNRRKQRDAKSSVFKGVSHHTQNRGKWVAQAHSLGRSLNLGSFRNELSAALAYDDFAFERDPEHCLLNFPERKRKEVSVART